MKIRLAAKDSSKSKNTVLDAWRIAAYAKMLTHARDVTLVIIY